MTLGKVFHTIAIILGVLFFAPDVHAQRDNGEFATSVSSRYRVYESGDTEVLHEVRLTNLTPLLFVSEYTMTIGGVGITNIRAIDDSGTLPVKRSSTQTGTTIQVNLESRPQLGIGRTKTLTIKYTSPDIATIVGKILEVNIPSLQDANALSSSQVTVEVPVLFGKPTRVSPGVDSMEETPESIILGFTNAKNGGISAIFGNSQSFSVRLSYVLTNATDNATHRTITLVPDTAYQRVTVRSLSLPPVQVTSDNDGNWLAEYEVRAQSELRVTADLMVETFMEPTIPVPIGHPEEYLQPAPFWDVDDEQIRSLARSLQTPSSIFQYVTTHLAYSYTRVNQAPDRRGALAALANPSDALCTEFTDLFIALSRAAGIPARELNGFAYSENPKLRPLSLTKDILHAWPEYWDGNNARWIPVDPTWANTAGGVDYFSKLDFNHIVFAIHGTSSTEPLSAGFFASEDVSEKTVFVTPVTAQLSEQPETLSLDLLGTTTLPSYRPTTLTLRVKNLGARALYDIPISIDHQFQMSKPPDPTIPALLPGEERRMEFAVRPHSWWKNDTTVLTVTIGNIHETYQLSTSVGFGWGSTIIGVLALAASATVALALRTRRLHISR